MELRPIERTDRSKSRLNAALEIYRRTILPEAQNPEAQIIYWIDHSRESLADEFRCFALQRNAEVLGYLQYSYFREEHIFFFEYLCIQDSDRNGLLHSDAIETIENFLAQSYLPGFIITFEVARRQSGGQWLPDKKLLRYFARLGFRQVDFPYRYPILQSYDGPSSYPADLMVMLPDQRAVVSASEMRTILRCIYFKHYLRWDRPFLKSEQFARRERLINDLYSEQVATIKDDDTFGTTGLASGVRRRFLNNVPNISALLRHFFSPKLPRFISVALLLLGANWCLAKMGSRLLFIPFVLVVALVFCLVENTRDTRRLFVLILAKLNAGRSRS
jgi:hypothetical protein